MKDITELTPTEIGELIRNNCAFQDRCVDSITEFAIETIEEWLFHYKWRYSISNSRGDYLHMPNEITDGIKSFAKWYIGVQADYELFDEDEEKIIREYLDAAEHHLSHMDEFNVGGEYDIRLVRARNDAQQTIFRKMLDEFDYDDARLLDEAVYIIDTELADGDYYVTDEWEIVQDVPEVVIPRHMETIY